MNKRSKIIVLGTICIVLLIGAVILINNKENAEVTDIPSTKIDKYNENISSESDNVSEVGNKINPNNETSTNSNEDTNDNNLLDISSGSNIVTGNSNGGSLENDTTYIPDQPIIMPPKEEVSITQEPNIIEKPPTIPEVTLPTIGELKQFMINY